MTPSERKLLQKLDQMIINASDADLKKIQEIDVQTQMTGSSLCDAFVNSDSFENMSIKQESRKSRK